MKAIPRDREELIERVLAQLEQAGVQGVHVFIKKLRDNVNNPSTVQDLFVEADAAVTFRAHNFGVTMQDRPDLVLEYDDHIVYAECRHYQEKTGDSHDEEKLARYREFGILQEYGTPAVIQDQILTDLDEKAREFDYHAPFIIVLKSSSKYRVEDDIVQAAVHVATGITSKDNLHPLTRISAVLFLSPWRSLNKNRSVYIFPMVCAKSALPRVVYYALESIRYHMSVV